MKLDNTTDKILIAAYSEAKIEQHEYFTPEHILYSSLFFDDGREIIENCGGNSEAIKEDLIKFLKENMTITTSSEPMATIGVDNVLQTAASHVSSSGRKIIKIGDIYAALLEEKDCYAGYFLQKNGVSRLEVLKFISHGISGTRKIRDDEFTASKAPEDLEHTEETESEDQNIRAKDFLSNFTIDLTEKAKRVR